MPEASKTFENSGKSNVEPAPRSWTLDAGLDAVGGTADPPHAASRTADRPRDSFANVLTLPVWAGNVNGGLTLY